MSENHKLDATAQAWADKMFPCEKPCDSYGVCSNCCERSVFQAGYNFAARASEAKVKGLVEALEFCKINKKNIDRLHLVDDATLVNLLKIIDQKSRAALKEYADV